MKWDCRKPYTELHLPGAVQAYTFDHATGRVAVRCWIHKLLATGDEDARRLLVSLGVEIDRGKKRSLGTWIMQRHVPIY